MQIGYYDLAPRKRITMRLHRKCRNEATARQGCHVEQRSYLNDAKQNTNARAEKLGTNVRGTRFFKTLHRCASVYCSSLSDMPVRAISAELAPGTCLRTGMISGIQQRRRHIPRLWHSTPSGIHRRQFYNEVDFSFPALECFLTHRLACLSYSNHVP